MGRWPAGAQDRLQHAAIELFAERGYDRTTVAEIATRAGLTERSFYNHFTDKREVLFPGQGQFIDELVEMVRGAVATASPLDAVVTALLATVEWFDRRRDAATVRRQVIDSHVELQEREAAKTAALTAAIAGALREREQSETASVLTAAAVVAAYQLATRSWLVDPRRESLGLHLRASIEELRVTVGRW